MPMDSAELNRLYNFNGKTIVITGGSGIQGAEIARARVVCGANVAILARDLEPAQQLLEVMGPRAHQAGMENPHRPAFCTCSVL